MNWESGVGCQSTSGAGVLYACPDRSFARSFNRRAEKFPSILIDRSLDGSMIPGRNRTSRMSSSSVDIFYRSPPHTLH